MPKTRDASPPRDVPQPVADGLLLYQARKAVFKLAERSLLEAGLSAAQMMMLGMLYWDGRALVPRRMCNNLVVERQALTGVMDQLEAQGLAKRLSHPKDRRKIRIQITTKGREKYEEASARTDPTLETCFQALTPSERQQLSTILLKLRAAGYPLLGLSHEAAFPSGP